MTQRHGGDESEEGPEGFDWLYGTSSQGVGSNDATQVLPGARQADGRAASDDSEPTQVMKRPTEPPPSARGVTERDRPPKIAPTPGGKPPRPPKSAKSKKRRRIGPGRIVLLVLALWLAFMIAVPLFAWNTVSKVDAEPDGARPADQPGTTYLLVGSDSREGLTKQQRRNLSTGGAEGRRTDTIMLLHTGDGPNLLVSIPRDSLVEVPGHDTTKINAAYAFGGAPLLVETIEKATGIRVDNYVEIGFGGFVSMVDAVGGITICPTDDMVDPKAGLDIKKGCQDADGRKALAYARSRHTSQLGDIERAEHQREVVAAVGSEAFSPMTFLNPFRYYDLAFSGAESINVGDNVSPIALANFAVAMRNVSGEDGLTCGVPISDLAVHWDQARAEKMFKLIREDRTSEVGKSLCRPSGLSR
jgi:LCP family protein required for cell wall assembly